MRRNFAVRRLAAALSILAMVAGACGGSDTPTTATPTDQTTPAGPAATYPRTVTACGKPVTIAKAPQRVVVDNTAVAEIVIALGAGDRIMSQFIDPDMIDALPEYKDKTSKIPSLGGATSSDHSVSKEVLLSALPDLVIPSFPRAIDTDKTVSTADLASIGAVPVQLSYGCPGAVAGLKIDDQLNDILLLGEVFGAEAKAKQIVDGMRGQLADVQRRVGNLPKPPVASFWVSGGKISPFGAGIPEEIVRLAGGTNVWSGQQPPTGQAIINISDEAFASKPVDAFIITNLSGIQKGGIAPDVAFDTVAKLHPSMPASVNKKYVVVSGHAQQPSLVAIKAVVDVAKTIHPEAF
jgi:iron complex transport system substrate-binding protein